MFAFQPTIRPTKASPWKPQEAKIRVMAVVQDGDLADVIVDAGESAKSLVRPGMVRLLALDERKVDVVVIAKLDRLTRRAHPSVASAPWHSKSFSATSK